MLSNRHWRQLASLRATDQRASALVACWSLVNVERLSAGPVGRVPVAVSGAPDSGGPSMCEGRQGSSARAPRSPNDAAALGSCRRAPSAPSFRILATLNPAQWPQSPSPWPAQWVACAQWLAPCKPLSLPVTTHYCDTYVYLRYGLNGVRC